MHFDSIPSDPTFTQRLLGALRYWWWLALGTLLLAAPGLYFAGRSLAHCFESSVVIGFPVLDASVDTPLLRQHAVGEAIDQSPGVDDVLQQNGFEPLAIPQLGHLLRRGFLRTQLAFEPMPTTIPHSVALRIHARERSPLAASTVAAGVGQAILDQMEAKLLPGGSVPAPAETDTAPPATPTPASAAPETASASPDASASPATSALSSAPSSDSSSAPPVAVASASSSVAAPHPPQFRKIVTWRLAPGSLDATRNRARLSAEMVVLEERRSRAQNDLGVLAAQPKVPIPRSSAMRPSNEVALKSQLNSANDTLNELQRRYTGEHPDVIAAQQRVRDLQAELEQAINKNALIAKQDAAVQIAFNAAHARMAREAELQAQISQVDAEMARDSVELDSLGKTKSWIPVVRYVPVPDTAAAQPPAPQPAAPAPNPTASNAHAAVPSVYHPVVATPASAAQQAQPQRLNLTATIPVEAMFVSQPVLLALSAFFAMLLALLAVSIAERTSSSVKDAYVLETELPYSVEYMGEIPRMTR